MIFIFVHSKNGGFIIKFITYINPRSGYYSLVDQSWSDFSGIKPIFDRLAKRSQTYA